MSMLANVSILMNKFTFSTFYMELLWKISPLEVIEVQSLPYWIVISGFGRVSPFDTQSGVWHPHLGSVVWGSRQHFRTRPHPPPSPSALPLSCSSQTSKVISPSVMMTAVVIHTISKRSLMALSCQSQSTNKWCISAGFVIIRVHCVLSLAYILPGT